MTETKKSGSEKLWGGRFSEGTAASVEAFTASIHYDSRLYKYDIAGSKAHAAMLAGQWNTYRGRAGGDNRRS